MDSDELSSEQLRHFAELLAQLERKLDAELSRTDTEAAPVDLATPIGRLSRMDAIQHQKMAQATREQQRRRLSMVRLAKEAIVRDEYGLCRVCEEAIDPRRLEVRPESLVCSPCQAKREKSA